MPPTAKDQAMSESKPESSQLDWVCIRCGRDKIQGEHWVELNTGPVMDSSETDAWCPACNDHVQVVQRADRVAAWKAGAS